MALGLGDLRGLAPGSEVAVSIRPHRIAVARDAAGAHAFVAGGWNVVAGTVVRVVYFGDALDVQVAVGPGVPVLRVSTPPAAELALGQAVTLGIAPEACVVLPSS